MDIKTFIDNVASGQANDAKENLTDMLSNRAFEALGERKTQMASTLFSDKRDEQPAEASEEETVTVEVQDTEEE